ncbi:MAG: hypothetical protein JWO41_377 [Candidatus Saccharibacteria bacterium]|nr:hypothetical protein [Candidatus Saccharibacteria bacterium]
MQPDEPNEEEKLEELPEDNGTPFSPPDDAADKLDDTHPVTDTNIDPQEVYDEGLPGAAEAKEP